MSPAILRHYRAQRLLERDFRALRSSVLATVAARLRSAGASLDRTELDACYATAWQGLYGAALAGEEIANPRAWLVLVTYRRAIEELRTSRRHEEPLPAGAVAERDLDGELDDRDRLAKLLQGMRARLDVREREAAALCYLHGYSRREAAQRMGVSETRMRKLMEGAKGRAGVSAKLAELAETIRDGGFCDEQASLMRALAFGVLDPEGERYRLAVMHRRDCPACRRYVATLRGAAVVLPPVLTIPGGGAGSLLGLAGLGHHAAAAPAAAPLGASAATGGGGSWALGSGLGAKLAAGCLLVAGVGAGCLATLHGHGAARHGVRRSLQTRAAAPPPQVLAATAPRLASPYAVRRVRASSSATTRRAASTSRTAASAREFTPEQPVSEASQQPRATAASAPSDHASSGSAAREFSPG